VRTSPDVGDLVVGVRIGKTRPSPLCSAVRCGLRVSRAKLAIELSTGKLFIDRDDVDVPVGGSDGLSELPVKLIAYENSLYSVLTAAALAFHSEYCATAIGGARYSSSFIDLRQSNPGTVIASAKCASALDEIQIESPAVRMRSRFVAPFDRPGTLKVGFLGLRRRAGRASTCAGAQGDQKACLCALRG